MKASKLRTLVTNHYRIKKSDSDDVECCFTGAIGNGSKVQLAHLLPASCTPKQFKQYGIQPNDYRNLVFLAVNIEKAFDKQRVTFTIGEHSFKFVILDPFRQKGTNIPRGQ
mmetsp:Transcript_10251/g.11774  ORF Transcript_10251/g.11774 Transcript_10251/m.11774 type:complete len:111 (-) Transcript_10251:324-656(-)